jgi:BMFP domain-containing protein YqiC
VIIGVIKKTVLPLREQVTELKARVLELEAQQAASSAVIHDD